MVEQRATAVLARVGEVAVGLDPLVHLLVGDGEGDAGEEGIPLLGGLEAGQLRAAGDASRVEADEVEAVADLLGEQRGSREDGEVDAGPARASGVEEQ